MSDFAISISLVFLGNTNSGNKICKVHSTKDSTICGTQNIVLNGKNIVQKDVVVRGDLAAIRSGRFCIIREGTIIRPSSKKFSKGVTLFPVHIGDHVMIEENCVISAAQICSFVHIGAGSVIGGSAVLKECCRVLPGSVVAADSVFPPYSTISGNPARIIGQEPECTEDLMTEATKQYYDNFQPSNVPKASFS
ncbi:unnamed protein product [Cylicocyclus nassatus]|uniref:Dynactin subunit 5 n=1 Tax=Cylicocyclus nassatus TaxID=53992 RepID=A0AA36M0J5_CYLNA|nr:unnamed protein product [Cylicocyclus nassatus]